MKPSRTTKWIGLAFCTLLWDLSLSMRDSSASALLVVITSLVVVTCVVVFLVVVALVVSTVDSVVSTFASDVFLVQLGSQYPQWPCIFWCEWSWSMAKWRSHWVLERKKDGTVNQGFPMKRVLNYATIITPSGTWTFFSSVLVEHQSLPSGSSSVVHESYVFPSNTKGNAQGTLT